MNKVGFRDSKSWKKTRSHGGSVNRELVVLEREKSRGARAL